MCKNAISIHVYICVRASEYVSECHLMCLILCISVDIYICTYVIYFFVAVYVLSLISRLYMLMFTRMCVFDISCLCVWFDCVYF